MDEFSGTVIGVDGNVVTVRSDSGEVRTLVTAPILAPVIKALREDETSTGFGHADYPHYPGTLYDCAACESQCFCDDQGTCLFCEIQIRQDREEC